MRRSSVTLVLASTLPLALTACSAPEENYTVSKRSNYPTVQACVDDKVPVDVCSDAYMQAMADHRRIAPTYGDKAACEADFVPDYCQVTSDGRYMPRMGGFELALSGVVSKSQVDAARAQVESSGLSGSGSSADGGGGSGGSNGFLTGLLLGQVLNSGHPQYYSQPIYQYRDSAGSYRTTPLSQQVGQGKRFEKSDQAKRSGGGYTGGYYSGGSTSNSYKPSTSTQSSVSSTVSRGGFGSQATARSGWGGKSSYSGFSSRSSGG